MSFEFNAAQFEEYAGSLISKTKVPGVAVGISVNGSLEYFKGFGLSDIEKNQPVRENTVFGLASVTKSFTALAINMLAEENKLSLFHPVKRYLPEFRFKRKGAEGKMTLHHFMSHSAGIPPLPSISLVNKRSMSVEERLKDKNALTNKPHLDPRDERAIRNNEDLLNFISKHDFELLDKPGKHVSYSNDCFSLLGEVVQRVSGMPFEDFLRTRIWEPLGMDHTFIDINKLSDFETQGLYHREDDGTLSKTFWGYREAFSSSGAMKSCIKDLLRYMEIYTNRGVVDGKTICQSATADRMTVPYYPLKGRACYAYGLEVAQGYSEGTTLAHHGGNIVGVASYIGFVPEKKIAVAVLTNLSGFPASKVFFSAMNLALGLPLNHHEKEKPVRSIPLEHLKKLTGEYSSGEGASTRLSLDSEGLAATVITEDDEKGTYRLLPTGYDSARAKKDGEESDLYFLFNPEGKVWAMRQGLRLVPKVK